MRVLLITDGKVSGEMWGATVDEVLANNPAAQAVPDTFGLGRVIGMSYAGGVLSGEPTPEPVAAPQIPQQVTMRQACLELDDAGLLDDVEALVATLPRPYQIEWQRASDVRRDNALVEVVRVQQGMTEAEIDELFVRADAR